MHERKKIKSAIMLSFVSMLIIAVFIPACAKNNSVIFGKTLSDDEKEILDSGFSVHFIDVGNGDCTVVKLPDGKVFMLDVGSASEKSYKKVKSVLTELDIKSIDYLVLSHPDGEHTGGIDKLFADYSVEKVYIPKTLFSAEYPEFTALIDKIGEENIVNPKKYDVIRGDGYNFAFLYADNLVTSNPSELEKDAVSPVIYLEYAGVRFILSADTTASVLSSVATDFNSSVMPTVFNGIGVSVNLAGVDFFKVGSHGSSSAFSDGFFDLIAAKRAIISVGDNYLGNPSSTTLAGLTLANETCEIYRTDVFGTISAFVSKDGEISVKKER